MGNVALGLNNLSNIKFGDNQVSSVYLGTNLVWSSYTYILDLYGPAYHAYSLRKLSSTYTGKAMRVRRLTSTPSAVTTTVDVAFDSNNRVSLDSAINFISGSPTTAGNLGQFAAAVASGYTNPDGVNTNMDIFVVTWFDQSGNTKNPTQASTPLQPKIVSAGILEGIDGSAGVRFTSALNQLLNVADTSTSYTNMSCYALGNSISATVSTSIYGQGVFSTNARLFLPSTTSISYNTASTFPISGITANVDRLYEIVCGASTTSAYSNGTISSVASVASVSATNIYIRIGSNGSPATHMNGHVKEVIAFIGTANRTNIETNINQYYTVW
jgi:hypothetical protein